MPLLAFILAFTTADGGLAAAGPFAVGNSTVFLHDPGRGFDPAVGMNAGVRTLITEIWYPAAPGDVPSGARRATYGDYVFGDRAVHRLMMTQTTFFHLTPDTVVEGVTQQAIDAAIEELFKRPRGSYPDAPLAQDGAPFPVVVMSHGDAGSRYNMQTVCEHLAAHGYVVVAPEHTGNTPYAMIGRDPALSQGAGGAERPRPAEERDAAAALQADPSATLASPPAGLDDQGAGLASRLRENLALLDRHGVYGAPDAYGQSYAPSGLSRAGVEGQQALDRALLQRLADLRLTLDALARMNARGFFAGALDLERIGLMGRSFGGATTLAAMLLEARFAAGLAVAAPSTPDMRPLLPAAALAPADAESVILSRDGPYGLGAISKPMLLLNGAEDTLIIGLAASAAKAAGAAAPSRDNPFPMLRSAYLETDAPVVWASLANANHGTFAVSGPYWWPQLKPNRFRRHFDPASEYRLVDAVLAHRIQQELALAFFDLMIRRDPNARSRLLDGRHKAAGLTLEHRNFQGSSDQVDADWPYAP